MPTVLHQLQGDRSLAILGNLQRFAQGKSRHDHPGVVQRPLVSCPLHPRVIGAQVYQPNRSTIWQGHLCEQTCQHLVRYLQASKVLSTFLEDRHGPAQVGGTSGWLWGEVEVGFDTNRFIETPSISYKFKSLRFDLKLQLQNPPFWDFCPA